MYNPISAKRLLSCFLCWTPLSGIWGSCSFDHVPIHIHSHLQWDPM